MNVIGQIYKIKDENQVTATFKKREFIIFIKNEKNEAWSNYILLEMIKDNCDVLNNFNIGDNVIVDFNLNGRLWTSPKDNEQRCFNTLQAWRITKAGSSANNDDVPF